MSTSKAVAAQLSCAQSSSAMSCEFCVNDVQPGTPRKTVSSLAIIDKLTTRIPRYPQKPQRLLVPGAFSQSNELLLETTPTRNAFVSAVAIAFAEHHPLYLKPVHFWLLISQAVAHHINKNADALRNKFVEHDGKKTLKVQRDGFALGNPNNDWAGVVRDFSSQIKSSSVPGVMDMIVQQFSDVTEIETVAMEVVAMDALQSFFEYKLCTDCGFPKITLAGTLDDWIMLRNAAHRIVTEKTLPDFAKSWLPCLDSVLSRIVDTVKTQHQARATGTTSPVDVTFWQSFCKYGATGGSGGYTWLNGWINCFFPYTKTNGKLVDNMNSEGTCKPYRNDINYAQEDPNKSKYAVSSDGIPLEDFPSGIASAPVTWAYLGDDIPLLFNSGFVGVAQDPKIGYLSPHVGYYIQYDPPQ
jgi:Domain of unknown function (DUF4419)